MIELVESTTSESAVEGETFTDFRDRMVEKALAEDLGIIGYHIDNFVFPPDYDPSANDGIGMHDWTEMSCDLRHKGLQETA